MRIPRDTIGRIIEGNDAGMYLQIEDYLEEPSCIYIYRSPNHNFNPCFDNMVFEEEDLEAFFKSCGWVIEWENPDAQQGSQANSDGKAVPSQKQSGDVEGENPSPNDELELLLSGIVLTEREHLEIKEHLRQNQILQAIKLFLEIIQKHSSYQEGRVPNALSLAKYAIDRIRNQETTEASVVPK